MSDTATEPQGAIADGTGTPTAELFPVSPASDLTPCTYSECTAGHRWGPRVVVAQCPGCQAPLLAFEMVNCPVCNEPTSRTVLRTEHVTAAMGVNAACRGEASRGERGVVELERSFHLQTEAGAHCAPVGKPVTGRETLQ